LSYPCPATVSITEMKVASVIFLAAAFPASATADSPIGKVLQLISQEQTKLIADGERALKLYKEYSHWCSDRSEALAHDVKAEKQKASGYKAKAIKEDATQNSMNMRVEKVSEDISKDQGEIKAAAKMRKTDETNFKAEETMLQDMIEMLQRAKGVLEKQSVDGSSEVQLKSAGTFTQMISTLVQASLCSSEDAARLASLAQQASEDADEVEGQDEENDDNTQASAPSAATYGGKSDTIIDTLESLIDKAESQLSNARRKEEEARSNFEELKIAKGDAIKLETSEVKDAKHNAAAAAEEEAVAEQHLKSETKDLKVDNAAYKDLRRDCMAKVQDYEDVTRSRDEELEALAKAKKMIADAAGTAEDSSDSSDEAFFMQTSLATSRTQSRFRAKMTLKMHVSTTAKMNTEMRKRSKMHMQATRATFQVVHAVRGLAKRFHSRDLLKLSQRVGSVVSSSSQTVDIFGKVSDLISDMIQKLEDKSAQEAYKKAYCDKELSAAREKRENRQTKVSRVTTKVDQMNARIAALKEDVATAQKMLAALASSQAELDSLRQREHAEFQAEKEETEQGLEGVKRGIRVLQEYYGKGKEADRNTGFSSTVFGLLEAIETDFAKSLSAIVASNDRDLAAYKAETKELQEVKYMKEEAVTLMTRERLALEKALSGLSSDRSSVRIELGAVNEYLGKIKKDCVVASDTAEKRKAKREAEIAGLKQALSTFDGDIALLQQSARRTVRAKLRIHNSSNSSLVHSSSNSTSRPPVLRGNTLH